MNIVWSLTLIIFAFYVLFSGSVLAAPPPMPVYIVPSNPANIQPDAVSVYVSNVTLGDIWVLQFVLGLVQCTLLGAIHGHQR